MAGDNRQEWAPDLEHTSFAQSEHSLHWVEISCIYSLNVSTQHSGRCLKDTISCPWNNLHWVVGRAESYWLRLTLVSAHSKLRTARQGHRRGWSKTSGRNSVAPCVCVYVCPFITREIIDRFWCGFHHWIANSNESDMGEKNFEKERKMGSFFAKNVLFAMRTS